jgi:hypothetical protein
MRVSALSLVVVAFSTGCVIREVPAGSQPAAPPAAAPPAAAPPAAAPPAAAPPAAAPPVATAAPAPGKPPTPAGLPGPAIPAPAAPAQPGGGMTMVGGPVKNIPPVMKGNNSFGTDKPIAGGSLMGLLYDIPANTTALPNFSQLTPFGHLYSSSWDVAPRQFKEGFPGLGNRIEWFAIRWEGKVTAKAAGGHLFRIKSDDGARLWIDGQRIVDNDGLHAPKDATGQANMAIGDHTMVIEYFQGPKYEIALQIWVTSPNTPEKILTTTF